MVDLNKLKTTYVNSQKKRSMFKPKVGETVFYLHGQCRSDDKYEPTVGLNFAEVVVHFNVGKLKFAVSLDSNVNPIIEHPFVKQKLRDRKIELSGDCPIKKAIRTTMSDDEADEARPQTKFMFGVTPVKYRATKMDDWEKLPIQPTVWNASKTIYEGIMDVFMDQGDVTDLDSAIYLVVSRTGEGQFNTRYKITAYTEKGAKGSINKPVKISGKLRKAIEEAMEDGGDCDLFDVIASMIKPEEEVVAALGGVVVVNDDDDDDESDDDESDDDESDDDESDDDESDDDESDDDESDDDESDDDESDDDLDALDEELDRISGNTKSAKKKNKKSKK